MHKIAGEENTPAWNNFMVAHEAWWGNQRAGRTNTGTCPTLEEFLTEDEAAALHQLQQIQERDKAQAEIFKLLQDKADCKAAAFESWKAGDTRTARWLRYAQEELDRKIEWQIERRDSPKNWE